MRETKRNYQEQNEQLEGHGIVSGPEPTTEEIQRRFDQAYGRMQSGRRAETAARSGSSG